MRVARHRQSEPPHLAYIISSRIAAGQSRAGVWLRDTPLTADPRSADQDPITLGDAELMQRIAARDARALEVLYDRYSRIVFSFALRIVGDRLAAEEILQEVFFRVWQQAPTFNDRRGSLVTWLLSITHNLAIDLVRRRRRRPVAADDEDPLATLASLPDTGESVEDEVWLSDLRAQVNEAMQQLPASQRDAIELAYFHGLTQREIADRLDQPLGTVKTRMRLGLKKLRSILEAHEVRHS
jgi:RNA polymerase sigma-70 factor (ECF subfamily)